MLFAISHTRLSIYKLYIRYICIMYMYMYIYICMGCYFHSIQSFQIKFQFIIMTREKCTHAYLIYFKYIWFIHIRIYIYYAYMKIDLLIWCQLHYHAQCNVLFAPESEYGCCWRTNIYIHTHHAYIVCIYYNHNNKLI